MTVPRPCALARPAPQPQALAAPPVRGRLRDALTQVVLLAGLFLLYRLARLLVAGHVESAFSDALALLEVERRLHLPSELGLQHLLVHDRGLARAADLYYVSAHFPITAAVLAWSWLRRPGVYVRLRDTLVLLTALGLAVQIAVPVAPPRMLPQLGFVDVAATVGPSAYGSPATDHLTNQYAALPSLHVGWALLVALALVGALHSRWRLLWLLHPLVTLLVVVGTSNHYWIDCLAAVLLLGLATAVVTAREAAGSPVELRVQDAVAPG